MPNSSPIEIAFQATASVVLGVAAPAGASDASEAEFRALYRELVETDTTLSVGSCTEAAQKMQGRLRAAGFGSDDARVVTAPEFPRQGNLVAKLPGTDSGLPPVLLLAHIDVVEAERSDWDRDPFSLVEEDGYVYARGALDDKAMAAIFTDTLIRLKQQGTRPRRTVKLALTCGEETDSVFNGVEYLLANDPESLDAGFALNEGGKSWLDDSGRPVVFGIQAGEKIYQDFTLTTTGPGGHSSRPGKDNPITRLAQGLARLGAHSFPARPNATTRNFFARSASQHKGEIAAAMRSVGRGDDDQVAIALLSDSDPIWNAMLRTTCIVTMVDAGHAVNAVAQQAEANVNCRILPGQSVEQVEAALEEVLADPSIEIAMRDAPGPVTPAPALTAEILDPIEAIAGEMWPGVPVIPSMSTGATDGRFLLAAGIPTYGVSGIFVDPDGNGVHGLNERLRTKSLMNARDFLNRLIRAYTGTAAQ